MPISRSTALTTFAYALTGVTDNQVRIVVSGGDAFTDGQTIILPDRGVWEGADFRVLCGVACHEVSHVWFGSNHVLKTFLKSYQPERKALARLCFNAVIDVADETRFARAWPAAEPLFREVDRALLRASHAAGKLATPPPRCLSANNLLVNAVSLVRSQPDSEERELLKGYRSAIPVLRDACRILRRARERSGGRHFHPMRTSTEWRWLATLAERLIVLLERFPQISTAGSDSDDPFGDARRRLLDGEGPEAPPDQRNSPTDDSSNGLSVSSSSGNPVGFDEACYGQVLAAFRLTARRLARTPTVEFEDGHLVGKRLNRPHRAPIDGRCFRRALLNEGTALAVALAFDHSDSMTSQLPTVLPVGQALADALASVPGVEVAVWRYGETVERLPRFDLLRSGSTMGSTATHLVLAEMGQWLLDQEPPRKIAVLFTDGIPDQTGATRTEVLQLRRRGAALLVGALGIDRNRCSQSMPGSVIFDVHPQHVSSSLQMAIRHIQKRALVSQ